MPRLASVKDAVSRAAMEVGLTQQPVSTAVGSLDQDVAQMVALLDAVADEVLLEEHYRTELGDGYWILDPVTREPKEEITADTDLIAFDRRLAIDGLKYRFLKAKGLDYGEEMQDFTRRLNKLAGRINGEIVRLDDDEGRML